MQSVALAVAAMAAGAQASSYLGFSSGATLDDNTAKFKADFKAEFEAAQNLEGAPGTFNAVRLYTNIQSYSTNTPIEAFEAAIETNTYLLLGIWTSGTTTIQNELDALLTAVEQYGTNFTDLVIGMSIGSEDLYRNSVTGSQNNAGVGANPDVIVDFINTYKEAVADTALSSVPIGHVDTWDAFTNSSNDAVIDAIDWLGVDEYPFYQGTVDNNITNAGTLFDEAYDATVAVAGGKPVWVTETGWPYSGDTWVDAVPSAENAKYFWDEVGCRKLFGQVNTFWYILRDGDSAQTVKFAITEDLSTTPRFNLTCPTTFDTPSSTASASATATASSNDTLATASGSATSTASSSSASGSSGSSSSSSSSTSSSDSSSTSVVASGASLARVSFASLAIAAGVVAFL